MSDGREFLEVVLNIINLLLNSTTIQLSLENRTVLMQDHDKLVKWIEQMEKESSPLPRLKR